MSAGGPKLRSPSWLHSVSPQARRPVGCETRSPRPGATGPNSARICPLRLPTHTGTSAPPTAIHGVTTYSSGVAAKAAKLKPRHEVNEIGLCDTSHVCPRYPGLIKSDNIGIQWSDDWARNESEALSFVATWETTRQCMFMCFARVKSSDAGTSSTSARWTNSLSPTGWRRR